ncbi:hypothetical protein BOO86_15125 [Mycobacterium sp. CBMA 234]|uniref:hypothetical protein n=1 Tax=Mycolicibacterium sp. CBMA 234 TaxID=1918495 RepID=UPI0013909D50|nr:hypothetical protein [Mycolicibacterium sp. CBMA 234]MUL65806.1 hypothetical protein [Mycolicibacterium sp. CBMA 234]
MLCPAWAPYLSENNQLAVTTMQQVQETNLAWSLIDAAEPQLDARERHHVFVSVGAGDSFTAIRILLKLIAVKQIPLQPRLVQICTGWLEAYVLHEDYERLRFLIEGLTATATNLRPRAIVRSITCTRNPAAALAIAVDVYHHRGSVTRAG